MNTLEKLLSIMMLLITMTVWAGIDEDLVSAAKDGNIASVKSLIDRGADINAKSEKGETALMNAAINNIESVEILLTHGAKINEKDKDGNTALAWAIDRNYQYLNNQVPIVKLLIAQGADVNARSNNGTNVLTIASYKGNTDIVKLLIARGADVNAKNKKGETALMNAAINNIESVEILLTHGAKINEKDKDGNTALAWAIDRNYQYLNNQVPIVKLLIAQGADVNARSNNGTSVLTIASYEGNTDIVKLLIARGADVNAKNKQGDTALMWASLARSYEIIKLLIISGADVNARDTDGNTALVRAREKNHAETEKLLISKGAKYYKDNEKLKAGEMIIPGSCSGGETDSVNILMVQNQDLSDPVRKNNFFRYYNPKDSINLNFQGAYCRAGDFELQDIINFYARAGYKAPEYTIIGFWHIPPLGPSDKFYSDCIFKGEKRGIYFVAYKDRSLYNRGNYGCYDKAHDVKIKVRLIGTHKGYNCYLRIGIYSRRNFNEEAILLFEN